MRHFCGSRWSLHSSITTLSFDSIIAKHFSEDPCRICFELESYDQNWIDKEIIEQNCILVDSMMISRFHVSILYEWIDLLGCLCCHGMDIKPHHYRNSQGKLRHVLSRRLCWASNTTHESMIIYQGKENDWLEHFEWLWFLMGFDKSKNIISK